MKIISLHFKNLNSLKGNFKIDFTTPALANAGIFAITGPTGAGKSTILDAITLALYTITPRLGLITKKSISEKGMIVTKQTKEAFAHITFEVNKIQYKAEWGIAFTNRNNWGEIKHTFSKKEGEEFVVVAQNTSGTVAMVNEIIGLNKEQFTKAIVLSQGKFDEFLTAEKGDRYELLEIITGTDIYRKIGIKVFDELSKKNDLVKAIDNQLEGIEILTPEQIAEIISKKADYDLVVNNLKDQLILSNNLKQTKDTINQLLIDKAKIDIEYTILEEKVNDFKPNLVKLEEHELVLSLQVDYNNWKNAAAAINDFNERINTNNEVLKAKYDEKSAIITEFSKQINEPITESEFESKLGAFVKQVSKLDTIISQLKGAVDSKEDNLNTLYKQIPSSSTSDFKLIVKSVVDLNEYITQKDNHFSKSPLPASFNGVDYQFTIDDFNSRILKINEVIKASELIDSLSKTKNDETRALSSLEAEIASKDKDLVELNTIGKQLITDLEKAESLYNANQTLMSLDEYRDLLEEGEPCPCCGSKEHPFVIKKPTLNIKLEEKFQAEFQNVEKNKASIRLVEDSLLENNTNKKNTVVNINNIDKTIISQTKLYKDSCLELGLSIDTTTDIIKNEVSSLAKDVQNLKSHQIWNDTKQPLKVYINALESYDKEFKNLQEQSNKRNTLFTLSSITDYNNNITAKWTNVNSAITNANNLIAEATKSKTIKQTEYDSLNASLNFTVLNFAFESIDAIGLMLLSDANYQLFSKKKEALVTNKISLDTRNSENANAYQNAIVKDDLSVQLEDLKLQIKSISEDRDGKMTEIGRLTGLLNTNAENLNRVTGIQSQKDALKIEQGYYKTLAELIGDKEGDKFNNIIQRITLRHLFKMTNERLLKIMDRYQVDLGSDKNEDEIWVIDTYMGNERRVINSVSGGERFVISLAMALSLSDLASNNVKLESVFIDEGFGSLSPEELDNAISMLERMQVENEKTVGIISHVESLKERISTQIVVKKVQNGESKIFLKYLGGETSLEVA